MLEVNLNGLNEYTNGDIGGVMFPFIFGLGGCGERLANRFELLGGDTHLFNFSEDSSGIRRVPFYDYGGTGRQPDVGRELYKKMQQQFYSHMDSYINEKPILICVGLGGGSGSGILFPLLKDMQKIVKSRGIQLNHFIIGVIPENDIELRKRALKDIQGLQNYVNTAEYPPTVFIVDNDYMVKSYSTDTFGGYKNINDYILFPFRFFRRLASHDSGWDQSWKKLDFKDFMTIISVKGFADFRRYDTVKKRWVSLFSDIQDQYRMKAYCFGIECNERYANRLDLLQLHEIIKKFGKVPSVKSLHIGTSVKEVAMMNLVTGMPLSKRIVRLSNQVKNEYKKVRAKVKDEEIELGLDEMENLI